MAVSPAQAITERIGGRWCGSYGIARCPAHDDGRPSLSIRDGDTRVLFHCFAGCDSSTVADLINRYEPRPRPAVTPPPASADPDSRGRLARAIWDGLRPTIWGPSADYLRHRGIEATSEALRHDPAAVYKDGDGRRRSAPALTIAYSDNAGIRAIQRVFLDDAGNKHAMIDNKRFMGSRAGSTARLCPPARILGIAEGVEDAMSVTALYDVPCWAAGGIENYRNLVFPPLVERLILFTQHGKEAERAVMRGHDNLTAKGRSIHVAAPIAEMDWNDMLRAGVRS